MHSTTRHERVTGNLNMARHSTVGDQRALGAMLASMYSSALEVAAEVVRDRSNGAWDAEDVVSYVMERAVEHFAAGYPISADFESSYLDAVRSAAERWVDGSGTSGSPALAVPTENPEEVAVTRAQTEVALKLFGQLAARDRAALWLTEVEGRPNCDVAAALGVDPSHARVITHRAKATLRRKWDQDPVTTTPSGDANLPQLQTVRPIRSNRFAVRYGSRKAPVLVARAAAQVSRLPIYAR